MARRRIFQDGREVRTKFAKTIPTIFCRVGDDFEQIVAQWTEFSRNERLWGDDDPLFPKTHVSLSAEGQFEAQGLSREFWQTTSPIREVFKNAFQAGGLHYANPHLFRDSLAAFGMKNCKSPEEFKAWPQNIGHKGVWTTFMSHGRFRLRDRPN